jgi:hypothetical protein
MSKHTPGPWGYTRNGSDEPASNGLMPDGLIGIGVTGENLALAETRHGNGPANAKLIAAAPDLLEALKDCEDALLWSGGCSNHIDQKVSNAYSRAREAIARATE